MITLDKLFDCFGSIIGLQYFHSDWQHSVDFQQLYYEREVILILRLLKPVVEHTPGTTAQQSVDKAVCPELTPLSEKLISDLHS